MYCSSKEACILNKTMTTETSPENKILKNGDCTSSAMSRANCCSSAPSGYKLEPKPKFSCIVNHCPVPAHSKPRYEYEIMRNYCIIIISNNIIIINSFRDKEMVYQSGITVDGRASMTVIFVESKSRVNTSA